MIKFEKTTGLLAKSAFFYTIAIGMDSKYTYVSENYDKNFYFGGGSLLGKEFSITLHPDDVYLCGEVGALCFQSPDNLFPVTLRKRDGNGGYIFTQWEMQAIVDDNGSPDGIFCIGYNITEYIVTQNKLHQAYTDIAINQDRFHEIGLLQSHGVRRPLANIMGLASVLKTMKLDANLSNINDLLIESTLQLDQIIKGIIKLSEK